MSSCAVRSPASSPMMSATVPLSRFGIRQVRSACEVAAVRRLRVQASTNMSCRISGSLLTGAMATETRCSIRTSGVCHRLASSIRSYRSHRCSALAAARSAPWNSVSRSSSWVSRRWQPMRQPVCPSVSRRSIPGLSRPTCQAIEGRTPATSPVNVRKIGWGYSANIQVIRSCRSHTLLWCRRLQLRVPPGYSEWVC